MTSSPGSRAVTRPRRSSGQADHARRRAEALDRATEHLLGLQHEQGWWQGELETNVTMDAEDLLLREFLGIGRRSRPRPPPGGSGPASARTAPGPTSAAATPTCPRPSRPTSRCGWPATPPTPGTWPAPRSGSAATGGIPATRVFTRIWLALFGEWSWDDLPVMPPELIYLPAWFPLNVYDWACWARQTIVPLTIVGSLRPVRPLAVQPERTAGPATGRIAPAGTAGLRRLAAVFGGPGPGAAPLRAARGPAAPARAVRRAAHAPVRRVDHRAAGAGRLLGRHPAAVGVLADRAAPARLRPRPSGDRARPGRPGPVHDLGGVPDGPVRRLEACQSPVWDTVLAMVALADAGLPPDHPALRRRPGGCWTRRSAGPGDWQVRRPGLAPRRLGVRVRQRRLPGHRRHRRGACSRCGGCGLPAGRRARLAGPRGPTRREAATRAAWPG